MSLESLMPELSWKQRITLSMGALATLLYSLTPAPALALELRDNGWPVPPVEKARHIDSFAADYVSNIPGPDTYAELYGIWVGYLSPKFKKEHNIGAALGNTIFFTVNKLFKKEGPIWSYFIDTNGINLYGNVSFERLILDEMNTGKYLKMFLQFEFPSIRIDLKSYNIVPDNSK